MFTQHNNKLVVAVFLSLLGTAPAYASFDCEFEINNAWNSGATADIVVTNPESYSQKIENITATFGTATVAQSWAATVTGSAPYSFTPMSWNNTVSAGSSVRLGLMLDGQVDSSEVIFGGDCVETPLPNLPPKLTLNGCNMSVGAYLSGDGDVVVPPQFVSCSHSAEDPEGMPIAITYNWGDGIVTTENKHFYARGGEYTITLTASDGEKSTTASTTIQVLSSRIPTEALIHCDVNKDYRQVTCEDRGSLTTPGTQEYKVLVDGVEHQSWPEKPDTFKLNLSKPATYEIRYQLINGSHIEEQTVLAYLEDGIFPVKNRGLQCEFSLGKDVGYGIEATFSITNQGNLPLYDYWQAQLLFSGNTRIVSHENADMTIVDEPGYYLHQRRDVDCTPGSDCMGIMPGETEIVRLILQGDAEIPMLGGDCGSSGNRAPVASFGECPLGLPSAMLYADKFITAPANYYCGVEGADPDGDELTFTLDWGDGTVTDETGLTPDSSKMHGYIESKDYTLSLTVSDGELTGQATKTFTPVGNTLAPHVLNHCSVDNETLNVNCQDRGSFDPDGPADLGFAAFTENQVLQTSDQPFAFTKSFSQPGAYDIRYGITDTHNIVENRIIAHIADEIVPAFLALPCDFALGATHDYGTDATLTITNNTNVTIRDWLAGLAFPTDVEVVYHNADRLHISDQPGYYFEGQRGSTLAAGTSKTIHMILQGDLFAYGETAYPDLAGDCAYSGNRPPVIDLFECTEFNSAYVYKDVFGIVNHYSQCSASISDPDNDSVSYSTDWGDGALTDGDTRHQYLESGSYDITLIATDGKDSTRATTTHTARGRTLPGKTLFSCNADYDSRSISCEDRGSFDPDSDIQHALFIDDMVKDHGNTPLKVEHTFNDRDTHSVLYATADTSHVQEQSLEVRLRTAPRPVAGGLGHDCEFTWGETHDYGTEATLTVTNNRSDEYDYYYWWTTLTFDGNTEVVNSEGATAYLEPIMSEYVYGFEGGVLAHGQSQTVHMIIQGDKEKPQLGGTCVKTINHPPIACIEAPLPAPETMGIYGFSAACSSDPDGDELTYSWDFGDGTTATGMFPDHTFPGGKYEVVLTVSDGQEQSQQSVEVFSDGGQVLSCSHTIVSQWQNGFTAKITVRNQSGHPVEWAVPWTYSDQSTVNQIWGAELVGSDPFVARGTQNSKTSPGLAQGESVTFGFIGTGAAEGVEFQGLCLPKY